MTKKDKLIELIEMQKELKRRKELSPIDFFEPQFYQKELFLTNKKNLAVLGGNRAGKSIVGSAFVVKFALENPKSFILCLTRASLSAKVQQKLIYEWLPKDDRLEYALFSDIRGFANRTIKFSNGSIILFRSIETSREGLQGFQCDLVYVDEELENREQDILEELKMRLIDRNGILLRTLTPITNGIGSNLYDEFVTNFDNSKELFYWNTYDNEYLDKDVIDSNIKDMDAKTAEQRTKGAFVNVSQGLVYESFSTDNIVDNSIILPNEPILIAADFNISIMAWSIVQKIGDRYNVIDEISLRDSANTRTMCSMIKAKYGHHPLIFYIDAAGRARHTNSSFTDYNIIEEEFPNAEIRYTHIKSIRDRVMTVNSRLRNAKGEINMYIDKKCKILLNDLTKVDWSLFKGISQGLLTHSSDGLSYLTYWHYVNDMMPELYQTGLPGVG